MVLAAPLSYGDDATGADVVTIKTSPKMKQPPQYDYDADIDATFRTMETEAMERPSPDYLSDRQGGEMMMMDRADLIDKMHRFSTHYDLAPGAFHRAVSFVDRFLSAKKINRDERQICLLGAAAVFAAAKYEDRNTVLKINSDHVAMYAGCTRSEAVDQEHELVAVLGYRLSGPTAYTFVEHFMRHSQEEEVVRPWRITWPTWRCWTTGVWRSCHPPWPRRRSCWRGRPCTIRRQCRWMQAIRSRSSATAYRRYMTCMSTSGCGQGAPR